MIGSAGYCERGIGNGRIDLDHFPAPDDCHGGTNKIG
jgi:hypothetical protein